MKNIKTMKVFGTALLIFGYFIVVLVLGVYFFSEDKNEVENITAQHIIYQSIGELGGFSNGESAMAKTINVVSDNIDNPDIEAIVNCYTNTSATVFRDYLRAVNFSMGQFCKVQQNLEATSATNQNNSDRCTEPKSIIMSVDELEKLGRKYTGDFATDLARCKI
ncbi:MAG: hypothetical protein ACJAZP_003754 [Psychromonas sp.]|uniref:hypothetical protein n=1 Tax=Psychromonas sp. TaxID=1884585 RepID=UPI0039E34DE5